MANATGRPMAPLLLNSEERAYLERQVRRHRAALSFSDRCRVILRCADGVPSKSVAREIDVAFGAQRLHSLVRNVRAGGG